jgi:NDP-sugar pyrophosphorylase family protein
MQAVILAAGKGTRLAPITNTRSKGMLPILGKPILERIIQDLASSGLQDFVLVVSPEDDELREYFGRMSSQDIKFQFVDQTSRLGTAHALRLAAPYIDEDFVLSACDNLVPSGELERLVATWMQHPDLQALLSLERIELEDTVDTGIVTLDGDRVTGIVEKPVPQEAPSNISSIPLYIFKRRFLDYLPKVSLSARGEYELPDAIQMMIDDGNSVQGLFLQNRITLTTKQDLLQINLHFLNNLAGSSQIETQKIGASTKLVKPVFIEAGVEIGSDCLIGPGVYIEKIARIGDGVHLESVVVLRESVIPDNLVIRKQIVTK